MNSETISVLVADDHPMIINGLRDIIEREPRLRFIGQATHGREAREAYMSLRPDILLIDLNMPDVGGLEAIREIRAADPTARIIILTSFDGEEDIYRGLKAGAKAYMLKDASKNAIVDCMLAVAAGRKYLPTTVASKLANRFDANELSSRELEILRLVAEGKSNKLISRTTGIADGTTKFHIKNIFAKLGVASRTQAVSVAVRAGIVRL
jgi:DNA-binding NarL/FixJ family response regulator